MKPIFLSFSPFGCVAAGKLFAAVCSRFERYFWYKLIQVAMVSKVFRHLVHGDSPEKEWNCHLLESSINKITPSVQTTETWAIFFILPELLKDVEMT